MRRRWIRVGGVPPEGLTRGLAHISRSVVPSRGDNLNQRGYIIAWRHVITSWATAFQNPLIYSSHLVLALSRSSLAPSILTIMRTLEGEENLKGFHRIVWSTILSFSFDEIWSSIATLQFWEWFFLMPNKWNTLRHAHYTFVYVILPNLIAPIKSNTTAAINRNGVIAANPPTSDPPKLKLSLILPRNDFIPLSFRSREYNFVNCACYFAGIRGFSRCRDE